MTERTDEDLRAAIRAGEEARATLAARSASASRRLETNARSSGITDDRTKLDATIEPETGMQKSYLVLSEEERAKGFIRPVRRTYVHVGNGGPKHATRGLTDDERERYGSMFALWEQYPESEAPKSGRYWTNDDLAAATRCGTATTMGIALAETYARDPGFYGGTFCTRCRAHFPVGADGEFVWEGTKERVGT